MQRSPHPEIPWSILALLAVAALLLTVWQHRAASHSATSLPETVVIAVGRPLESIFTRTWAGPRNLAVGVFEARALVQENASLKRQLDEKQAQVTENIQYYLENKALRDSLGLAPERSLTQLPGRVIGLEIGPQSCRAFVQIQPPGVAAEGDIVIQDRGVVGRVIKVTGKSHIAEVMLLIDQDSAVAGRDTRSRDEDLGMGLIYPEATFSTPPMNLKMEKLRPIADLREGDLVVTSGDDKVYPPNLPIGTIQEVLRSPASAESITAVVKPFVDFFRLEFVYIVPKQK
jgi:rod shape-determining protein MreC